MKLVFSLALLIGLLGEGLAVPASNFAKETGKFSLNLYRKVVGNSQDNVVISPVSVQTALGLVYMGADGATSESMSRVMHLERDANAVGDSYKALLDHHAESGSVKIANKMFLDKEYSPRPEYNSLISEKFYSSTETLDTTDGPNTARVINSWVEAKTNNKIQDLVKPGDVENSTSILVNAVYFKADWVREFEKFGTGKSEFWTSQTTSKQVDMMRQESYFQFGDFYLFKVVNMPYKNTDMSMLVVLPHDREGLRGLEAYLDQMDVKLLMSSLQSEEVLLALPKFKVEFEVKLKKVLVDMGMGVMFTDGADFSRLSAQSVKVSDVIHKAVLEVDEKGTEAAAATAIPLPVAVSAPMRPPKQFTADHPFLYFLVDSNGHIFFMGRYVNFFLALLIGFLREGSAVPGSSFARETGKFSLNLYKEVVSNGQDNVVISPVSVQTALGLVYMGAGGATAESMSRVMHLERDANAVGDNYKALLDHHAASGSVKIANKMFLDEKYSPKPEFTSLVSEKFYSSAETLDTSDGPNAARVINSWVAAKTNNKIQDLVTPDDVEHSSSVLVNAVFFKAEWVNEFSKDRTHPRDFWTSQTSKKTVYLMHQGSSFEFGDFDAFKVINMAYKNTDMSLLVLLPHEREGLREIEAKVEGMNVKLLMESLTRENVFVAFPKFKTEFKVKLKNVLVEMGMNEIFSDGADFSRMSEQPVKVSEVIHKAVFEVDEKATVASASTAVLAVPTSGLTDYPPEPPKDFTADHPFLYLLVDSSGHVFFVGRYVK